MDAGYTAIDLIGTKKFGLWDIKKAGYTAIDLKNAGFSAGHIIELSGQGGYRLRLEEKVKIAKDKKVGLNNIYCQDGQRQRLEGRLEHDLSRAQSFLSGLNRRGLVYNAKDLLDAGYCAKDIMDTSNGYIIEGFDASLVFARELKDAGCTASDLKGAGCTVFDFMAVGFTPSEMKDAGSSSDLLWKAGLTPDALINAGYTYCDLRDVLINAGYTYCDLRLPFDKGIIELGKALSYGISTPASIAIPYTVTHALREYNPCDFEVGQTSEFIGEIFWHYLCTNNKIGVSVTVLGTVLKTAGFSAIDFYYLPLGLTLTDLRFTAKEIEDAEFYEEFLGKKSRAGAD